MVMLRWKGNDLLLGAFVLGHVMTVGGTSEFFVDDAIEEVAKEGDPYESEEDCRRDCETEVRRLLKEAGVEVDP